jgi:hypothetical protein
MSVVDSSPVEAERVIATVRFALFLVTRDGALWFLVVLVTVELSALRRVEVLSPLIDDLTWPGHGWPLSLLGPLVRVHRIQADVSSCLRLEFVEFARERATADANLPLSRRTRSLS